MFEYAINIIKEKLQLLDGTNQTEAEIYLGVSNICESISVFLREHGWRALYVEQGIFQLSRL